MSSRRSWIAAMCVTGLLLAGVCFGAPPLQKADFYVAPQGNDAWSGKLQTVNKARTDGPFQTLARARDAVRAARKADATPRAYTVLIAGGTYRLSETFVFGPEDSGAPGAETVYAAMPGQTPIFSGGREITGWRKTDGPIWTTTVPNVAAGKWYPHQLFVNGQRRTRARTPNSGYFRIAAPLSEIKNPGAERSNPAAKMGFTYREGDIKSWDNLDDVNVFVYHSWTSSLHWIKYVDEQQRTVRFTAPSGYPMGYWERNARYYVENCREALDTPGEWYLDRKTGLLSYWPLPGENMTKASVVAPVLQRLVQFRGESDLGLCAEYISLRGLSFQHADWDIPNKGSADGQSAVFLGAAVEARGARHCSFERCEIAHVGEYGLWLATGSQDNTLRQCHLHDLGGGGVRIGEGSDPKDEAAAAVRNTVDNCFIHDGGYVFPAGCGVIIQRASYNNVTHNEICDFYYTGVSVGWSWGYAPSSANHNTISDNHIHDLGKGELSDMGGIYSLGISPGTVERHNLIHDVYSYSYGGWGLYTDEGSSTMLLEDNIVYDTKSGGFHQHYGRENTVRNNIFAFAREAQIIRSRQEEHISFTFEHNIVLNNNGQILGSNWSNGNYKIDNNLYWDTSDPNFEFAGMTREEWQAAGRDVHSVIANPLFVDASHRDFRLKPGSPAAKIGFRPLTTKGIGLYGDPAWVNLPRGIVRKPVSFPPPPKLEPVSDDFEKTAVDELPANANVSEEGDGTIRVTAETAASGKHSLKFTDAPGLSHDWQPHMYYRPMAGKGAAHLSYDVRVEPGAVFWNDWRDDANPYHVGPVVRIEKNGELKAGQQTLLTVPQSQWIHLEFTCPLGKLSTGTYDLTVTLPGQAPRKFEKLPCEKSDFKKLQWLGFISLATEKAVFYLDNVKLDWVGGK